MSDQHNAYVSAYLDNAINLVHEQVNSILQLKTQLKIAESIISQKDKEFSDLQNQLQSTSLSSQNTNEELVRLREENRRLNDEHFAMSHKINHMDTLLKQVSDMKSEIQKRDAVVKELEEKLKPVVINTRRKKIEKEVSSNDDF
jgi:chromosome segregation ATPase